MKTLDIFYIYCDNVLDFELVQRELFFNNYRWCNGESAIKKLNIFPIMLECNLYHDYQIHYSYNDAKDFFMDGYCNGHNTIISKIFLRKIKLERLNILSG